MKFEKLLDALGVVSVIGKGGVDIRNIAYHTDQVVPDSCFVAIKGGSFDGHAFIGDAVKKGARVVVTEKPVKVPQDVTNLVVSDSRDALARISSSYFNEPSLAMKLIGVTGTNGKTTITYLLEKIFEAAGWNPGVIGTVEYRYGDVRMSAAHTTPESYELQKLLRTMADAGVGACAMEVSSHALDMERVVGCHFNGAVFTNLSEEHLDYHGEMESYFASKALLFEKRLVASLKNDVFAVINVDDTYGRRLVGSVHVPIWRYGIREKADVSCPILACDDQGIKMVIHTPSGEIKVRSSMMGRFNAQNILASVATGLALGVDLDTLVAAVEMVKNVPGRLERVPNERDILAFVDYAHTPDALKNVILHVKELAKRRLIVVFGCGGDRDRMKRPLMGEVVGEYADIAIVTSDNPRTEDPQSIIEMIVPGIEKAGMSIRREGSEKGYEIIGNRRDAIGRAVSISLPGDVVLVAGKGHEDYQIIGKEKRHFDDREVLREFLK